MNNGISRNLRKNKALTPNYISLDERTIQDMILFTLAYSKRLNYYTIENKVMGDWESFFLKDTSFIMAIISGTEINEFKKKNDLIVERKKDFDDPEEISRSLKNIFQMVQTILHWIDLLTRSNYKGDLLKEIRHLKSSLQEDFESLKFGVAFASEGKIESEALVTTYQELGRQFKLSNEQMKVDQESLKSIKDLHLKILTEIFHHVYGKMIFLKESANKNFNNKVEGIHNHHPHIGLLLAFFKLFQYVQKEINGFTKKHLDYYYKEILNERIEFKEKKSHSAMLALQLKNGVEKMIIEKDAAFEFDIEGESAHIFHSIYTTQINNAVIADIKSIYKSLHKPFNTKYEIDAFQINLLYETDILKRIQENKETPPDSFTDFPEIFGEESQCKSEMGFLISSPALILEKGIQEIKLIFKFEKNSFQNMNDLFLKLKKSEQRYRNGKIVKISSLTENVMRKFFRQAFKIFISDVVGWKAIKYSDTEFEMENFILKITIPLRALDDQLISFDPSVHEGNFTAEWPCIKLLLNNDATYHPYIFLKDLALKYIRVTADVSEVETLSLSNTNGEIDNSIPFFPFGPIPEKGSYLRIQNPKILHKNLSSLKLLINWNGLPQLRNGFKKYYEAYEHNIDNNVFTASLSKNRELLRNSSTEKQQEFRLFNSAGEGYLKNETQVDVVLNELDFNNTMIQTDGTIVKNATSIYIILKNPNIGFGHRIFPEIYSKSAMNISRFRKRSIPLPKQPFTPVIDQLTLNYTNTAKENVLRKQEDSSSDIKLIHLYPFGHVSAFPGSVKSQCFLLPQIEHKGNLFIGLQKVLAGDQLSIGFELISAVYPHSIINALSVNWKYLDNNNWTDLTEFILDDETNGLIKSGIMNLKIPSSIRFDNTRLPEGRFWIKAECDGIEDINSRVKNIFSQAIVVSSQTEFSQLNTVGNPEQKVLNINPIGNNKIDKVFGPMNFVVQSNKVMDSSYYSRVSENLRHKNRGITNWDIERIILEKFKQIQKIRVYGRNSYPHELVKGSTTQIVLIPKNNSVNETLTQGNKLDVSTLQKVKSYITQFVSPYTHVEVCNPVYEQLKVRCRVQFIDPLKSRSLRNRLNEELIHYLSPDIESIAIDRQFDESISKTEIFNFIEQKPFVEFVEEFSVIQLVEVNEKYKIIDTEEAKKGKYIEELRTISAYAILTSAPKHHIEIIPPSLNDKGKIKGIGDISIGSDFVIIDEKGHYTDN